MIRLAAPLIGDEECKAVEAVLRSGQLVHGQECDQFEKELADYLGAEDVLVVSSGTAALHLSLVALGIGPGDAVLVPDFTFPATINVVELVGAKPILVDVDPGTYNVTPEGLRNVILNWNGTETIKGIIPVHEFGCPVDMSGVMSLAKEKGLYVIEDAACALGAEHKGKKAGTYGDVGCFSFHPRKALTTGEGGAIVVQNESLTEKIKQLRNHGISYDKHIQFVLPGFNYRMTNFQAALGRVQLGKYSGWLKERQVIKDFYLHNLNDIDILTPEIDSGHSWQTFMLVLPERYNRDQVIIELRDKNIETNIGAYAIHSLNYYKNKYAKEVLVHTDNVSEMLYKHGIVLPIYQGLKLLETEYIVRSLREIIDR